MIRVSSPDVARAWPGPECVDQGGAPALASRPKRDPGAHHPCADDDEVGATCPLTFRRTFDHGVSVSVEAAAAEIAAGVNGSGTVSPPIHGPIWSL